MNLNKSEKTMKFMRNLIISGEWGPGMRIPSEQKLCTSLGVSRVTVRSAITKLVGQGLLATYKGKGTYVCERTAMHNLNHLVPVAALDKPDRMSIFEYRRITEIESAGLAAQRITVDMVDALRESVVNMKNATSIENIAKYDIEFHYLIALATNNPIIIKIFEILKDIYKGMFIENVGITGPIGFEEHRKIASAIELRDSKLAKECMALHLTKTIERTTL